MEAALQGGEKVKSRCQTAAPKFGKGFLERIRSSISGRIRVERLGDIIAW
jgi:hypothetical protein